MTGLLVITLLGLSPGVQLADAVPRHSHLIQLVDDESPDLTRMNRDDLYYELRRLEAARPTLVVPIVLLGLGAGLGFAGLGLFLTYDALGIVVLTGLVLVGAAVLVIVGGIMLAVRLARRASYAEQIDLVHQRMDDLERRAPELPPPPPPPPPPHAGLFAPAPQWVLAVF